MPDFWPQRPLIDGEPCGRHKGCLNHITHPCEGCGRVAGFFPISMPLIKECAEPILVAPLIESVSFTEMKQKLKGLIDDLKDALDE